MRGCGGGREADENKVDGNARIEKKSLKENHRLIVCVTDMISIPNKLNPSILLVAPNNDVDAAAGCPNRDVVAAVVVAGVEKEKGAAAAVALGAAAPNKPVEAVVVAVAPKREGAAVVVAAGAPKRDEDVVAPESNIILIAVLLIRGKEGSCNESFTERERLLTNQ